MDGRWILAWKGLPGEIAERLQQVTPDGPDEASRLAAALTLARTLPPTQPAELHLDLRGAESGHLVRATRRGHFHHRRWVLPWLVARGGPLELRVTRYAHSKLRRSFSEGQLVSEVAGSELDELAVVGPGGALRQPLTDLTALAGLKLELDPAVPVPPRLPATAPAPGAAQKGALLSGVVSSLVVLGLGPLLLWGLAQAARPTRFDADSFVARLASRVAPAVVEEVVALDPSLARAVALQACADEAPWARRHGLVLADRVLGDAERLQWLVALSERDPVLEVRLLAVDLLGRRGDLGATQLTHLHANPGAPVEVRQQAHRRLMDLGDPRALELARRGLSSLRDPPELNRTWARALSGADEADLLGLLEHEDAHVRATVRWALRRR